MSRNYYKNLTFKMIKSICESEPYKYYPFPKPTSKTNFEGFDTSKVESGYEDYLYLLNNKDKAINNRTYHYKTYKNIYMTEMTPQDYNNLLRKYIAQGIEIEFDMLTDITGPQKHFAEKAYDIANKMKNGQRFGLLILDFKYKEQDGRHRAAAAYINNYKTIPVILCY